jgi:hypothetical protein
MFELPTERKQENDCFFFGGEKVSGIWAKRMTSILYHSER